MNTPQDFLKQADEAQAEAVSYQQKRTKFHDELASLENEISKLTIQIGESIGNDKEPVKERAQLRSAQDRAAELRAGIAFCDREITKHQAAAADNRALAKASEYFRESGDAQALDISGMMDLYAGIAKIRAAKVKWDAAQVSAPVETGGDQAVQMYRYIHQSILRELENGGNGLAPLLQQIEFAYAAALAAARAKKS